MSSTDRPFVLCHDYGEYNEIRPRAEPDDVQSVEQMRSKIDDVLVQLGQPPLETTS